LGKTAPTGYPGPEIKYPCPWWRKMTRILGVPMQLFLFERYSL